MPKPYEYYKRVYLRIEVFKKLEERCRGFASLSDCIERLLSGGDTAYIDIGYICGALEKAVRLANRFPGAPESRAVFEEYERLCVERI